MWSETKRKTKIALIDSVTSLEEDNDTDWAQGRIVRKFVCVYIYTVLSTMCV